MAHIARCCWAQMPAFNFCMLCPQPLSAQDKELALLTGRKGSAIGPFACIVALLSVNG